MSDPNQDLLDVSTDARRAQDAARALNDVLVAHFDAEYRINTTRQSEVTLTLEQTRQPCEVARMRARVWLWRDRRDSPRRGQPSLAVASPRCDRRVELELAHDPKERPRREHQVRRRRSLDGRHVGGLVVRLSWAKREDRAFDESTDALNNVAIGHRHSDRGRSQSRGRSREKSCFALEDADEPMEI